ncbi:AGE family epimerase/isomerase [Teredinibacter purpureus]|uniref:AGE family epimerase/isomerase n=1 Tax=Teredinibacter purpureus TaxID=2731756 RepID=UPI0005F7F8AB|nr:AGE family epimerase/isomerase [Teredinibacter purpureus]
MSDTDLRDAAVRWVGWMKDQALPRWASDGINAKNGAAYERFLVNGVIDEKANARMRVQARQMFVFSIASVEGWMDSALSKSIVDGISAFSETNGRHPSGQGYVHVLAADYTVADGKRDLYDHAFFLLSCAARFKAFGDEAAIKSANDIMAFLDSELGQVGGGWLEGDYDTDRRRQNPHMHMFEALLSLYDATGDAKWLARAGEIFGLFETQFFDAKFGVLREFFNHDWTLLDNDDADIIEPGHMMEWVWLLRWYERVSGHDVSYFTDVMYEKGLVDGMAHDGILVDAVSPTGDVINGDKRSWAMTELIKASLVQAEAGIEGAKATALAALNTLMDAYISDEHAGLYVDQLDADSVVVGDTAQASILYHLLMAIVELDGYVRRQAKEV